jgi:hypothetical protein
MDIGVDKSQVQKHMRQCIEQIVNDKVERQRSEDRFLCSSSQQSYFQYYEYEFASVLFLQHYKITTVR